MSPRLEAALRRDRMRLPAPAGTDARLAAVQQGLPSELSLARLFLLSPR